MNRTLRAQVAKAIVCHRRADRFIRIISPQEIQHPCNLIVVNVVLLVFLV